MDKLLKFYINDVKPDYVIMSTPWITTRAEVYDIHGNWGVLTPNDDASYAEHQHTFSDQASMIRWVKNLDAIKWLCHDVGAKLYAIEEDMNDVDDDLQLINNKYVHQVHENDFARDLVHYGRETHNHNAEVLTEALNYIMR